MARRALGPGLLPTLPGPLARDSEGRQGGGKKKDWKMGHLDLDSEANTESEPESGGFAESSRSRASVQAVAGAP